MARRKSDDLTATITFRLPSDVKDGLEDLAHLSRRDVSSLLVEVTTELVKVNASRITKFRESANIPIVLPTFRSDKE